MLGAQCSVFTALVIASETEHWALGTGTSLPPLRSLSAPLSAMVSRPVHERRLESGIIAFTFAEHPLVPQDFLTLRKVISIGARSAAGTAVVFGVNGFGGHHRNYAQRIRSATAFVRAALSH